ncbi:KRAB-A domain-containing protein 2 [Trichonephila clavipes]|nr:KRAB-A domain-containing protein 2 [Trichonephila clavipes]
MSEIGECRLSPVNVDTHQIRRGKIEYCFTILCMWTYTGVCRQSQICSGGGRKERRQRSDWLFSAKSFVLLRVSQLRQSYASQIMVENSVIKSYSKYALYGKNVKIAHGKPRHSQTQVSVERANQDIHSMLTVWMNTITIQINSQKVYLCSICHKNTTYHERIRQSPYETMFGFKAKRGIASSFCLANKSQISKPKNILKKLPIPLETEEQLEETGNTSGKNFSGAHTENHMPKKNIEEDLESTTSSHQVLAEKHELISKKRADAKANLLLQATKMLRTSQKKFAPAQIGDTI